MTGSLAHYFESAADLLELEPEELAGPLLALLNGSPNTHMGGSFHLQRIVRPGSPFMEGFPESDLLEAAKGITEAWGWLEREGFIAPRPGQGGEWFYVTRRGQRVADASGLVAYRRASILPRATLHPLISGDVWPAFLRGDYDTAIFQSFRRLEVEVRSAGGFQPSDLGVSMMRQAFKIGGSLADPSLLASEQQAVSDLFAGAIGWAKNPQSHRIVAVNNPVVAAELISLASYLMRIVDERRPPT